MKSYMTIDRLEGKFAACELEFISVEQSREVEYWDRDMEIIDVPITMLEEPKEGDVFVVEHEKETLYRIYGKDNEEKRRKIEALKAIMG